MPVEFFPLNSLPTVSDRWRMKNARFQNVLKNKTTNAFGTPRRYLRVGGILRRMRSFLLTFYQIEMQSTTPGPGQVYRESIYAFSKARNNHSLYGVVIKSVVAVGAGCPKGWCVRKGGGRPYRGCAGKVLRGLMGGKSFDDAVTIP